jgi:hypothetical protein
MRIVAAALLLASPAAGWEFSALPVCTLSHNTGAGSVTVTWDPGRPQPYAIALAAPSPWPDAPVLALRFDGPRAMTLATDRHARSADGRTLTVTDTGFGNVLDGLEFNRRATALADGAALPVPLDGAAGPVQAFRACTTAPRTS